MSDRSLTLLALHLEDARIQIGPLGVGRSGSTDAEAGGPNEPATEPPGEGATPVGVVLALVVTLLAILALRRRSRSEKEDEDGLPGDGDPASTGEDRQSAGGESQ